MAFPIQFGLPQPVPILSNGISVPSIGIFYSQVCQTIPNRTVCRNASNPDSALCEFGAGQQCRLCNPCGVCPGGFYIEPRPGCYARDTLSWDSVFPCYPPATRCLGWNATIGQTQCGVGYKQGSDGCLACDNNYYPALTGECSACPQNDGALPALAAALLKFCGTLVAVTLVLWWFIWLSARVMGTTMAASFSTMRDFFVFAVSVFQLVAQVGKAAGPGLPPYLAACYGAVSVFQLDGVAVPPSCTGSDHFEFTFQLLVMTLAVFLSGFAVLMVWDKSQVLLGKWNLVLGRFAIIALNLLYPIVTNAALGLFDCVPATLTGSQYEALDHSANTYVDSHVASVTSLKVEVLNANRFYVCFEDQHLKAFPMAVVAFIVYVVLYPWLPFLCAYRRMKRLLEKDSTYQQAIIRAKQQESARLQDLAHGSNCKRALLITLGPRAALWWYRNSARAITQSNPLSTVAPHSNRTAVDTNQSSDEEVDAVTDGALVKITDPIVKVFIGGDYRPSQFWFKSINLGSSFMLSLILILWPIESSGPGSADIKAIIAKAATSILILAIVAFAVSTRMPFNKEAAWKHWVQLLSLLVTSVAAIANAMVADGTSGVAIQVIAWLATILCGVLLVVLLGCFISSMLLQTQRNAINSTKDDEEPINTNINIVALASNLRASNNALRSDLKLTKEQLADLQRAYNTLLHKNSASDINHHTQDSTHMDSLPVSTLLSNNPLTLAVSDTSKRLGGTKNDHVKEARSTYAPERTRRNDAGRVRHSSQADHNYGNQRVAHTDGQSRSTTNGAATDNKSFWT